MSTERKDDFSSIISLRDKLSMHYSNNKVIGFSLKLDDLKNLDEETQIILKVFLTVIELILTHFPNKDNSTGSEEFKYVMLQERFNGNNFSPLNLGDKCKLLLERLAIGDVVLNIKDIELRKGVEISAGVSTDVEKTGYSSFILLPKNIRDLEHGDIQFNANILVALFLQQPIESIGENEQFIASLDNDQDYETVNMVEGLQNFIKIQPLLHSGYIESFISFITNLAEWLEGFQNFSEN